MKTYSVLTHLPQVAQAALAALRNPAANPSMALLAIAAVAVVVLIVVVLVALVILLVNDLRAPKPPAGEPVEGVRYVYEPRKRRRSLAAAVWLVLAVLAFVGIGAGWAYATKDSTCASCHVTAAAFASRARDARHSKIACASCHVTPGIAGAVAAAATGAGNLRIQYTGTVPTARLQTSVSDAACLTCHADVRSGVVLDRGIRMRHSDVLAVGYSCMDCHNTIGHAGRVVRPRYPEMSQCISCHDGTKAKSACSTCHSKDVGNASRVPSTSYSVAQVTPTDCRGCHSVSTCIKCHGLELPHSQQFISGFHARQAVLQPQLCMKCHTVNDDCNKCHDFAVTPAGLPLAPHNARGGFITWHKGVVSATPTATVGGAGGAGVGSCSCHIMRAQLSGREQLCLYCHGPQPSH